MSKPTALIDVENYDEYLDELSHQLNIDLKPVTEPLYVLMYGLTLDFGNLTTWKKHLRSGLRKILQL